MVVRERFRRYRVVPPSPSPRLLDVVRAALQARQYSIKTQQSYVSWIRRFVVFHGKRHPKDMGADEIRAFVSYLATDRRVAASTQNQALSALLFLYREVIGERIGWIEDIELVSRPVRLPTVLTRPEVDRVLGRLVGPTHLMASLLYGSGLRVGECCSLRVKDVDIARREIIVRDGKGNKDRVTVLPNSVAERLRAHLGRVQRLHESDLGQGMGRVELPKAYDRKAPHAAKAWAWQWVFPAARLYTDRRTGELRRGITRHSRKPSRAPSGRPESQNGHPATRSVTRSPRISSNPELTFARSKSYSDTATSGRR